MAVNNLDQHVFTQPIPVLAAERQLTFSLAKIGEISFRFQGLTIQEQILFSREQQPHPRSDDRERIIRARQAAEALFKSDLSVKTLPVAETTPADQAARKPRVLQIVSPPASVRRTEPERSIIPLAPAHEISPSQFGRIRAWMKYGMTTAQVAQLYGVSVSEIERILGKA
jgi:hypothetical protein